MELYIVVLERREEHVRACVCVYIFKHSRTDRDELLHRRHRTASLFYLFRSRERRHVDSYKIGCNLWYRRILLRNWQLEN